LERSDLTPSVLPTGFTQRENKVLWSSWSEFVLW
jgi:hypothetical protein